MSVTTTNDTAVQVSVRVPADLRDWLEREAAAQQRSVSWVARAAIETVRQAQQRHNGNGSGAAA